MKKFLKIVILSILLIFMPLVSSAADPWDRSDIGMEIVWQLLHVMDWGQTRDIAMNPDRYWEFNPILGKHPSVTDVNAWFFFTSVLHLAITHVLPDNWRPAWQIGTMFGTGALVIHNRSIGLRVRF
jgi:hypothetical protein